MEYLAIETESVEAEETTTSESRGLCDLSRPSCVLSYSPSAMSDRTASWGVRRLIHITVGTVLCVASPAVAQTPFHLEEATISTIRVAFASGQLTCAQLTKLYLDRIDAYNLKG